MGDHYLRQYYLKGFVESLDSEFLYRYQKGRDGFLRTSIKNVAHETKFYSKELESYLANEIEGPANSVLKKIREFQTIGALDKRLLGRYIVTMIKRVPQNKKEARVWLGNIIEPTLDELASTVRKIAEIEPDKKDIAQRRLAEIEQIRRQKKIKPDEIWYQTIPPETTPDVNWAVESMTWQFFCTRDEAFITGDNPVFFFREIGLGNDSSELVFPISTRVVLMGSWIPGSKAGFHRATERHSREFNRRMASSTTRYAFFSQGTQWVSNLLSRKRSNLARLVRNGKVPYRGLSESVDSRL
jgi:hypothetical protein